MLWTSFPMASSECDERDESEDDMHTVKAARKRVAHATLPPCLTRTAPSFRQQCQDATTTGGVTAVATGTVGARDMTVSASAEAVVAMVVVPVGGAARAARVWTTVVVLVVAEVCPISTIYVALTYTFADRRDYGRDDRRRDNRRDYDRERDRDGRRGYDRDRDGRRDHHDDSRDVPRRDGREREDTVDREARSAKHDDGPPPRTGACPCSFSLHARLIGYVTAPTEPPATKARMNLDPDAPEPGEEEGEAMEAVGDDDAAMMAMMGMSGFGTTKVRSCSVTESMNLTTLTVGKASRW
jgi:hypothetical protein